MGLRVQVPSSVPIFVIICFLAIIGVVFATFSDAGWSSLVARRAHNPKVVGSNPAPATTFPKCLFQIDFQYLPVMFCSSHLKASI